MPHLTTTNGNSSRSASAEPGRADRENIFDAFRRWGYLQAQLDPLGRLLPDPDPELDIPGDVAEAARRLYCGRVGADFMHLRQPDRRRWIQDRMENPPPTPARGFGRRH